MHGKRKDLIILACNNMDQKGKKGKDLMFRRNKKQ